MIVVLQRVTGAEVTVAGEPVGGIGTGLVILAAIEKGDTEKQTRRMAERVLGYRVFPDSEGRMNLSVTDIDGGLLLVPQFTLAADTRKGSRPSFTPAADPETGQRLFDCLVTTCRNHHPKVETGRFGANMQVSLVNDGPVTFILKTCE